MSSAALSAAATVLGHKPVFWCHECETALADAEVGIQGNHVAIDLREVPVCRRCRRKDSGLKGRSGSVIIWTTTPWTLPSNLAIALDPAATYIAEDVGGDVWVMAEALRETSMRRPGTRWARSSRPSRAACLKRPRAVIRSSIAIRC